MQYTFQSHSSRLPTTATADNEEEARILAMRTIWGSHGDAVCPDGPKHGDGLILVGVKK
jgi:hypothetical protein